MSTGPSGGLLVKASGDAVDSILGDTRNGFVESFCGLASLALVPSVIAAVNIAQE